MKLHPGPPTRGVDAHALRYTVVYNLFRLIIGLKLLGLGFRVWV